MAFPTAPLPTLNTHPDILPTVTLTPPLEQVPSRSLHVKPLAFIPLVIGCFIICVTSTYVWKLWQREDKYYVEEGHFEEEFEDLKATAFRPGLPGSILNANMHERRSGTPQSLTAAREGARAASLRSGISRSIAARTLLRSARDQTWAAIQTREHDEPNHSVPVQIPSLIPSRPTPSRPPAHDRAAPKLPDADESASHRSTDTWERKSDGKLERKGGITGEFRDPDHEVDLAVREEAQRVSTGINSAEYGVPGTSDRISGIDWKDNGSSVQGSDFTKYGFSEFDRSSYTNRYEDY